MNKLTKMLGLATVSSVLAFAGGAAAGSSSDQKSGHTHAHADKNAASKDNLKEAEIKDRGLSDWEGNWQSVYPYLLDGTLDPVMVEKAKKGDKSEAEYRAFYDAGYKTDVDRIDINGQYIRFFRGKQVATGTYEADGYEIITYKEGDRGVRTFFKKVSGDSEAPGFIAFSDHATAPKKAEHYHLYSNNDRAALLKQMLNWPTYYPARLNGKGIVEEILAH